MDIHSNNPNILLPCIKTVMACTRNSLLKIISQCRIMEVRLRHKRRSSRVKKDGLGQARCFSWVKSKLSNWITRFWTSNLLTLKCFTPSERTLSSPFSTDWVSLVYHWFASHSIPIHPFHPYLPTVTPHSFMHTHSLIPQSFPSFPISFIHLPTIRPFI